MKTTTKIGITFTILSVLVIVIGVVFAVLVKNERTIQENIITVKNTYTDFSVDIVDIYQLRIEVTAKIDEFNNETYAEEHETYTQLLTNYNKNISSLNNNVIILEDKCAIKYEDNQTNIFCENYQQLYESAINIYVDTLKTYNNKLALYNETGENYFPAFKLMNNYVDFNNDGVFSGKADE